MTAFDYHDFPTLSDLVHNFRLTLDMASLFSHQTDISGELFYGILIHKLYPNHIELQNKDEGGTLMLEGHHYQNGYITRNIDKAIEQFRQRGGVEDVTCYEVPVEITTPKGKGTAVSKLAFIWINNLQYELIQPVSGLVDVYTDELPEDDSVKFHHTCMRVPDWDEFRARVEEMGYPVVLEGGSDQLKFLYLDARDVVGHYLEYTWMTPERWKVLGGS